MSTAVTAFLNGLYSSFPRCPQPEMLNALTQTIRDYCDRAWAWQSSVADIEVQAGTDQYTVAPPDGAEIVGLVSVRRGNETEQFEEYGFYSPTLTFDEMPSSPFTLHLRAALRPSMTATTVENFLYQDHYEAIVDGAKARLYAIFNREWTNPDAAIFYGKLFDQKARSARVKATTRLQARPARSGKPFF